MNFNGLHYLKEFLPSVIEACRQFGPGARPIVIDNGSDDGSRQWLAQAHPEMEVVALDRNYGFGEGYNRGLEGRQEEVFVLLNNDMKVSPDFLQRLLEGFQLDPHATAVASQVFFLDPSRRREETGFTSMWFAQGRFHYAHLFIPETPELVLPVSWVGGGACAIPREVFRTLGGFDPLFYPAYAEDAALSYAIWKRGGRCVLATQSVVHHVHRGTSRNILSETDIRCAIQKHRILLEWLYLTDIMILLRCARRFPGRIRDIAIEDGLRVAALTLYKTVTRLPELLWKRFSMARDLCRDDIGILTQWQQEMEPSRIALPHPSLFPIMPYSCVVCAVEIPHRIFYTNAANAYSLIRCEGCGSVRCQPPPAPDELIPYCCSPDMPSIDYIFHIYQRISDETSQNFSNILTMVDRYKPSPDRVLQVGYAQESILSHYRQKGAVVEGIAISPENFQYSRKLGMLIMNSIFGNEEPKEEGYDLIVARHCLGNSLNPIGDFDRVAKGLAPGGILCLTMTNADSLVANMDFVTNVWEKFPKQIYYFTPVSLSWLAERHNMFVKEILTVQADSDIWEENLLIQNMLHLQQADSSILDSIREKLYEAGKGREMIAIIKRAAS